MEIIEQIGSYAGLAAIVGLAVLSALYFSQARDLRRLRESQPGAHPTPSGEGAPASKPSGAKPVPGKPAPAAPAAAGGAVGTAATAGASATQSSSPAASAETQVRPAALTQQGPARQKEVGEGASDAAAAASAGSAGAPAGGDTHAPATAGTSAPSRSDEARTEAGAPNPIAAAAGVAGPGPKPSAGVSGPGSKPSAAAARPRQPVAANSGGQRPAAARLPSPRPGAAAATLRAANAPSVARRPPWYRRLAPRYLVLILAGLLVVSAGAIYAATALVGDEERATGVAVPRGGEPAPLDPSTIEVAILNGTQVSGLGEQVAETVESAGFQRGNVSNAPEQGGAAESVVLFAEGAKRPARQVGQELGIAQIEPLDAESEVLAGTADVTVIVGGDRAR